MAVATLCIENDYGYCMFCGAKMSVVESRIEE